MAYEFKHAGEVLSTTCESFWLYTSFDVDQNSLHVQIKDGYLATYFSQQGNKPAVKKPLRETYSTCEIKDSAGNTLSLKNLTLVKSRLAEYSNEIGCLHLFRFEQDKCPDWFSGDWNPAFANPTENDDGTPFLEHHFSFDSIEDRHLNWISVKESFKTISSISVVTPFLGKSIFNDIIKNHDLEIPKLKVKSRHGEWSFPQGVEDVIDTGMQGFVMVAEGGFSAIRLDDAFDEWFFGRGAGGEEVMTQLTKCVFDFPTNDIQGGIQRQLYNSRITQRNSVIPVVRNKPFEMLHLRGINDDQRDKLINDHT